MSSKSKKKNSINKKEESPNCATIANSKKQDPKQQKNGDKAVVTSSSSVSTNKKSGGGQEKKANKKEADKLVNDGVKLMKKAEEENNDKKKTSMIKEAKTLFKLGLDLMDGAHADSLYNLALAELELVYDKFLDEDNATTIQSHLAEPRAMLATVIANDTSRRGETTGLAHRMLANISCRYYEAISTIPTSDEPLSFQEFLGDVKAHMTACKDILANHIDLDVFIFEYCELFYDMLSNYMESFLKDGGTYLTVCDNVKYLRQQCEECLQTPQSSGIDMDVQLLDGSVVIAAIDFFISILKESDNKKTAKQDQVIQLSVDALLSDESIVHFLRDITLAALSLHETLVALAPEDPRVQSEAGDLLLSAVQLNRSLKSHIFRLRDDKSLLQPSSTFSSSVFQCVDSSKSSVCLVEMDYDILILKLIACRCIAVTQTCTANNLLALADDLKDAGDIFEKSGEQLLESIILNSVLELLSISSGGDSNGIVALLQKQSQIGKSSRSLLIRGTEQTESVGNIERAGASLLLYAKSRDTYESALSVCRSDASSTSAERRRRADTEEAGNSGSDCHEPDDIVSLIHYNLLCVLWKLKEFEACQDLLKQYLKIELENNYYCNKIDPNNVNNMEDIISELLADPDLRGIEDSLWFATTLLELNLSQVCIKDSLKL